MGTYNDPFSSGRARGPVTPSGPLTARPAIPPPAPVAPTAAPVAPAPGITGDRQGVDSAASLAAITTPTGAAGTGATAAARQVLLNQPDPEADAAAPTGRSPETFGHVPKDLGQGPTLTAYNPVAGRLVWADTATSLTPAQWLGLDGPTRDQVLKTVPPGAMSLAMARVTGSPTTYQTAPGSIDPRAATTTMQAAAWRGVQAPAQAALIDRFIPVPRLAPPVPMHLAPSMTPTPAVTVTIPPRPAAVIPPPRTTGPLPPAGPPSAPPPDDTPRLSGILTYATGAKPSKPADKLLYRMPLGEVRKLEGQLRTAKTDMERAVLQSKLALEAMIGDRQDIVAASPLGERITTMRNWIRRLETTAEPDRFAAIARSLLQQAYDLSAELPPKHRNAEVVAQIADLTVKELTSTSHMRTIQYHAAVMGTMSLLYAR